jgi:hypothetical protein
MTMDTLMVILRYLYTDHLKLTSVDEAVELWFVGNRSIDHLSDSHSSSPVVLFSFCFDIADRYQLGHLKGMAEFYLSNNLTIKSALQV